MKTLTATTVVAATFVACSFALAQSSSTPQPGATSSESSKQMRLYEDRGGEVSASKLIGTLVRNDAGETVGSINDLLLTADGKAAAVVMAVGGFLGIGEREVAITFDSLKLSLDPNSNTIVTLHVTKDALKAAPQWKWRANDRTGR